MSENNLQISRNSQKNNKFNKNQDFKKKAKKDPEMSTNTAIIAKVTRIFLANWKHPWQIFQKSKINKSNKN